ncbi:Ecto-NOX disulfide-thiol exchanger 1 [Geodia barretti]|uniref:Ecto-NOX disulfide-thiol exchanger 1 n=1 Tax=Geodia barretti TaxID=519541 RepID=A0AA35W527_GEOBA|nr:Ecto-NOX disulfide-thiol exchanger 1 [Geodia barretti]
MTLIENAMHSLLMTLTTDTRLMIWSPLVGVVPVDPLPPLPPLPAMSGDETNQDPTTGVVVCGSVILIPTSPFDKKPNVRTKHGVCKTVFVGSLPDNATNKHLQDMFSRCGKVIDVRVSKGRNFGHVQFEQEEDVERALQLSGCRIRIGPSSSLTDTGRIHVDYAQPRSESEMSKRAESSEPLPYNGTNAGMISADLHGEDTFWVAAKNVKTWIERGNCNASTTNMFFGLISSCNTHSRKIAKKVKELEKEEKEFAAIRKTKCERLLKESKVVKEVLMAACAQRTAWDGFTKPQRKSINQWKDAAASLSEEMQTALDGEKDTSGGEEPAAKKVRVATPEPTPAYEVMMEDMKTEHAAALRKKETQIMQLNTLISQFKQKFPEEWEKAIGGEGGASNMEVKVEIGMEDGGDSKGDSLAAEAAVYAKLRSVLGSTTDEAKLSEFSEAEIAIITVLSTYLTVNPLGATMDEIAAYFNRYNPAVSGVYLESLLHRLPQVFQVGQQASGEEKKWWFLGFQTCCSQGQYAAMQESEQLAGANGSNPSSSS